MKILAGLALLTLAAACSDRPTADRPSAPAPPAPAATAPALERPTLVGFAKLPPDTFTDGPRSGQFIKDPLPINGRRPPFDRQPVQGVSDVVPSGRPGELFALSDNGYGAKANSADYLLCVYRVKPSFRMSPALQGAGGLEAGDGSVKAEVAFRLRDPDRHVKWSIVADGKTYPGSDIPVPEEVRNGRLLTGADFDVESIIKVGRTFWLGDEFGPFLLQVDDTGKLLRPPVELPGEGMHSPDHPTKDPAKAKIARSAGFEAMALLPNWDGRPIGLFLEKPLAGETGLRYLQYDISRGSYDPDAGVRYPLPKGAVAVGAASFTLPGFVMVERDDGEGDAARHKWLTLASAKGERLKRTPIADLLDIDDPDELDRDGSRTFRFPFWTIETVQGEQLILVVNDNNYPFSAGRKPGEPDATEFILIRLPRPLEQYGAN